MLRLLTAAAALVAVAIVVALPAAADNGDKVTICHKPGTPAEKTLSLPEPAAAARLALGDTLGPCGTRPPCSQPPVPALPEDTGLPVEEEEWVSDARATLEGASPDAFNPTGAPVSFRLSCPTLAMSPDTVAVYLNGRPVPFESLALAPDLVTLTTGVAQGLNDLMLVAQDVFGFTIEAQYVVWAGNRQIPVVVRDAAGQPFAGATVVAQLADDAGVTQTITTDALGQGRFVNLPVRSYHLTATAPGNLLAVLPFYIFDGTANMTLRGVQAPSPVDNNDFSLGTAGWNIGSAPVWIVPHEEEDAVVAAADVETAVAATSSPTKREERAARKEERKEEKEAAGAIVTHAFGSAAAPDFDLMLGTAGEGLQSISRTFTVEEGVKSVTVRYRFITSEVPGGWFGSQYNDFYNVAIRSVQGGDSVTDANSMNGLGLGAFDGGGATAWREAKLEVDQAGDTVQVDVGVANVADGLFNSQVVVDAVKEKALTISDLSLRDIDNTPLTYLSAAQHPYFGGNTRVHGTITIEGPEEDTLTDVKLEVLEGGAVIATGTLAAGPRAALLNRQFGPAEELKITTSALLFEIPAAQLARANNFTNGNLTLRVKAKSSSNEEAEQDGGSKQKLVYYDGTNRYPPRDPLVGGDDWAKPTVRTFVAAAGTGFSWGDFSNMNGGPFPPHNSHQTGNSIDGWFSGYNDRNATTAATIVGHLNTYGRRIRLVYVTFAPGSAFANAIANVTLNDGRRARDVIRNISGHRTHFHWEVTD